jgi:transcriptional regulator with XRE-family HTH domain
MDEVTIRVQKALRDIGTTELGARAGVSRYQAWRWETGRPGVAPETVRRLEQALFSNNGTRSDSGNEAA